MPPHRPRHRRELECHAENQFQCARLQMLVRMRAVVIAAARPDGETAGSGSGSTSTETKSRSPLWSQLFAPRYRGPVQYRAAAQPQRSRRLVVTSPAQSALSLQVASDDASPAARELQSVPFERSKEAHSDARSRQCSNMAETHFPFHADQCWASSHNGVRTSIGTRLHGVRIRIFLPWARFAPQRRIWQPWPHRRCRFLCVVVAWRGRRTIGRAFRALSAAGRRAFS